MNKNRTLKFVFLVLFFGCIFSTAFSLFVGMLVPDGVVKDFFILTKSFGFGQSANNWYEFGPIRFKLGFFFDISILSVVGFFISWYLLRYFK